jgi:hypothetical protein
MPDSPSKPNMMSEIQFSWPRCRVERRWRLRHPRAVVLKLMLALSLSACEPVMQGGYKVTAQGTPEQGWREDGVAGLMLDRSNARLDVIVQRVDHDTDKPTLIELRIDSQGAVDPGHRPMLDATGATITSNGRVYSLVRTLAPQALGQAPRYAGGASNTESDIASDAVILVFEPRLVKHADFSMQLGVVRVERSSITIPGLHFAWEAKEPCWVLCNRD